MNSPRPINDDQLDQLLALAAQSRPDTSSAEFAFETRVMAQIRQKQSSLAGWSFTFLSFRLSPFLVLAGVALFFLLPEGSASNTVRNGEHPVTSGSIFDSDESTDGGLWEDVN
jgi:hypothetical protein